MDGACKQAIDSFLDTATSRPWGHSAKMSFYSGILYIKFFDYGVSPDRSADPLDRGAETAPSVLQVEVRRARRFMSLRVAGFWRQSDKFSRCRQRTPSLLFFGSRY